MTEDTLESIKAIVYIAGLSVMVLVWAGKVFMKAFREIVGGKGR